MFKNLLSQRQIKEIDAQERELRRLHGLGDLWLAYALMRLSRQARESDPCVRADDFTYDTSLVWYVIPELARRLGFQHVAVPEIDWELRSLSPYDLRIRAGACIKNSARRGDRCSAWSLLTRSPCNGKPIGIAADRLQPGDLADREDYFAYSTHEVCRYRGVEFDGVWSPALLQAARSPGIAEPGQCG